MPGPPQREVAHAQYAPLSHYRRVLRGDMRIDGDRAHERLRVIVENGHLAAFVFVLRLQPQDRAT